MQKEVTCSVVINPNAFSFCAEYIGQKELFVAGDRVYSRGRILFGLHPHTFARTALFHGYEGSDRRDDDIPSGCARYVHFNLTSTFTI